MSMFEKDISLQNYVDLDVTRYSAWAYDGNSMLQVFDEEKPNTVEIWMEFHGFSYIYWKVMENECIDEIKGGCYYNFYNLKKFMIRYLLVRTNFPGVVIERDRYGRLTDSSYESVMRLHPRILRVIFSKVSVFPKNLDERKKSELEKQCFQLFGKGEAVKNPLPDVSLYCNLTAFWDKFGLNYFDVMKLPNELFNTLKHIMSLDNEYKSQALESRKNDVPRHHGRR